jgi:hypothetical protein
MAKTLLSLLAGGDRRSIGRADEVAATVLQSPGLFSQLMAGLWSADSLVRMRAADAVEKISRQKPDLLRRYKNELLGLLRETAMKQLGRPRAELRSFMCRRISEIEVERRRCGAQRQNRQSNSFAEYERDGVVMGF